VYRVSTCAFEDCPPIAIVVWAEALEAVLRLRPIKPTEFTKSLSLRISIRNRSCHTPLALAAAAALLLSCGGPREHSLTSAPDHLDGSWELRLERRAGLTRSTRISGRMFLRSEPADVSECAEMTSTLPCSSVASGTHMLRTRNLVGYDLPADAGAYRDGRDSVVFLIGGCCDRGEISGSGRWTDGGFQGRWTDQRLGGNPIRGSFTLHRLGS
jgi:hypothetical protein